jgi:hypothetical protein
MLAKMLLLSFTLSALAVVGAVGWLGRTDSPLVGVGAVVLALVLTALVLGRLMAMLPQRARRARHPWVAWLVPGVAAVALLVPLAVTSVARAPLRPGSSPEGTVRGFLGAVVDRDGVTACRYLTAGARRSFERSGATCESFFGEAELRLGGHGFITDGSLGALQWAVSRGHEVTVAWHGHRMRFVLHPASATERAEFLAPATPWRIASSVSRLA